MNMSPQQEAASKAAAELAAAVVDLCVSEHNEGFRNGDYAVILRAVNGSDGLTFTWDWFWKPDPAHKEAT